MNRNTGWIIGASLLIVAACSHQPPADFAPDPGLLAQIREIQITPNYSSVCPGNSIAASYEAVLDDGTHVPFVRTYDEKHPPRLHVTFLSFSSTEASSRVDGSWVSAQDPLLSATTGFRLSATLKAKPSIHATVMVRPDYSCAAHAFAFEGAPGGRVQAGENGPTVTVNIGRGRSPFYEKLIVVGIQVGAQAPFYELYDAASIPPADFIAVESRGGRGGAGSAGPKGGDGAPGAAGCPAQAGGTGGDGGYGGPGAPGGRGGAVMIVAPTEEPYMAGLVTARTPGGYGGPGGAGGPGGVGGRGGQGKDASNGTTCANASDGLAGRKGQPGPVGSEGPRGPRPEIVVMPADQQFGRAIPTELAELLPNSPRRP
jgi:hypothetical protein